MRRVCLILSSCAALLGCTDDPLPSPTVNPASAVTPEPPATLPDLRFARPPPRDMTLSDMTLSDMTLSDAGDLGLDASADATPDAARIADAQVDMAAASCQDDPCVLAVELARCEACPIALPSAALADLPCTVPYDQATPLFEYIAFACTADCPVDSLQVCNAPIGQPVCGDDDRCRVAE
jgi:hypothetical protein